MELTRGKTRTAAKQSGMEELKILSGWVRINVATGLYG